MPSVNLTNDGESVILGGDNVAIVKVISTVKGGASLDVSDYPLPVIYAGHPIVKHNSTKVRKPLPIIVKGAIKTIGAHVPGSGYTNNGTYTDVSLTGGTGSGAKATIVVAGNAVTSVTLTDKGTGYKTGDILSAAAANIGTGGSGFAVAVTGVSQDSITYGSLPANHAYEGSLVSSITADRPFASIMDMGVINPAACPFDFSTVASAFKTAVPLINQSED